MKSVEREFYNKNEILQIVLLNPEPRVVPLDRAVEQHGTLQLLAIDDKKKYYSQDFIKISEHDDIITGYKMTGKDTLSVVIPINQVEKIQLQDKETSSAITAIIIVGAVLGVATIAGLSAISNSLTDG